MSWQPIIRALAAAAFLIIQTLIATLFIVCIYAIEAFIKWLWGAENPLILGFIPLTYVFQLIDLGFLAIFGYRGIVAANKAFEE